MTKPINCTVTDSGRQGPKGESGINGNSLFMGAPYDTLEILQVTIPTGQKGELHVIGGTNVYGWNDITKSWIFTGPWAGAQIAPDWQEQIANMIGTLATSALAVGSIIPSASVTELAGQKWTNGQILPAAAANYAELLNYVLTKGKYVTFEEYSTKLAADGQCAVYGWNGTDLRLPFVNRPIAGEYTTANIGNITPDTMRPIKATVNGQYLSGTNGLTATGMARVIPGTGHHAYGGSPNGAGFEIDSTIGGSNYNGAETRGKQVLWPYAVVYTTKIQASQPVPNYIYRAADQSSAANILRITIGGGFTSLPNNTLLIIKAKHTNTGASFISINGGDNIAINLNDAVLPPNIIIRDNTYAFVYNQTANVFDLLMSISAAAGLVTAVNGLTGNVVLTKALLGLGAVDNTSDMDKPVSTAVMNKVFPVVSDLGNLNGAEINIATEACYKGVADGSFKLILPIPTDGRTHSFRLFVKAETNANISFNKKIMYDSAITDYGDLISGKYYDYIFTFQPILNKWQMFRKEYTTEPSTLQLLLRFNGNLQDSSPTNLSSGWTPFSGENGVVLDTVNRKFPDNYTASIKKANQGIASALADAEKLKTILTAIGTGDFTIGIWVYCPENGISPAYNAGLFRFVTSNGYTNINDFGMPIGWDGVCALGIGNNYDQQHVWWNAGSEVWTKGWHYLETNRKAGVAYITFDGILKTSGPYTADVSAGKENLAYMQLFGWNAGGSTAVSFQEFFILSKASHIADFTPPTAPFVVEED